MLYTNCDIPAKLFYNEVIGKSNLNALGKGSKQKKEEALKTIIDELYELEDNRELIELYRKQKKITDIVLTQQYIQTALHRLAYIKETHEQKVEFIKKYITSLKYPKIKWDFTKPIPEEIIRAEGYIKMLNNQLNEHNQDNKKKSEKIKSGFEDRVASINKITGCRVQDTDTLRQFIAFENIAKETIKAQEKAHGK